jgi:beta-phosphoglucomutase-like phosphatase (HAD superfamily)
LHLVVFDIDATLTDTNAVHGDCYWQAVCEVLGLSGEHSNWPSVMCRNRYGITYVLGFHSRNSSSASAYSEKATERVVSCTERRFKTTAR